ncbi:MAG: transcription termination/antitermination protein NusG [Planctomycetota bacterium]|nr:MAG: transcription termination/antitermination protein NusG [Planctomycetota bacterium]
MAYEWYFVRCQSGREDSIRKQLETRIKAAGLQDVVPQILVPVERVTELKAGKKKVSNKKLYPGYLMVQADIDEPELEEAKRGAPAAASASQEAAGAAGGTAQQGAIAQLVRIRKARLVLRETPGFGDFLGARGEPTPLEAQEVTKILARMSDSAQHPQVAISLRKGDMVKIKSGAFDGFDGQVDEINPDKGTVKVIVTIFGRPTPVELEYWEVEAV